MKNNYATTPAATQNPYGYTQTPYTGYPGQAAYPSYGYNPYMQAPAAAVPTPPTTQLPGMTAGINLPGMLPIEESYIENILRLNKGKIATIYMTFENNQEWNAKIFRGVIEAAGRDHIIISDPETGKRYLLLMIYLDYVTFDEELDYEYPY